jgi:hypothetical protein
MRRPLKDRVDVHSSEIEHRKTTILPLKCEEHIGSTEEHSFRTSIDQSPPRAKEDPSLAICDVADHCHGPVVRLHLFKFVIYGRQALSLRKSRHRAVSP